MFKLDVHNFDPVSMANDDVIEDFKAKFANGSYRFLDVLYDQALLDDIIIRAKQIKGKFENFVFLGTGGSSLGAQTLCELSNNRFKQCNVHFIDNVDHNTFDDLVQNLDLAKTCFFSISKSGTTAETLCQTLSVVNCLKKHSLDINKHLVVITEPKDSPLTRLAMKYNLETLAHDVKIGGRFSVFSVVGLLPAALAGVDVEKLQSSARQYLESIIHRHNHYVDISAKFAYQCLNLGRNISVMMPYLDKMYVFSKWYAQLWAESIGKDGKGSTPVSALGTVDQHSQLQLYRDGPDDKCFTFLLENSLSKGSHIMADEDYDAEIEFFQHRTMGDLLLLEAKATVDSLKKIGRPIRAITFEKMDEATLGQLLVHFMCETIIVAGHMGVDPFDQPGVEESKVLTKQYMSGKV